MGLMNWSLDAGQRYQHRIVMSQIFHYQHMGLFLIVIFGPKRP